MITVKRYSASYAQEWDNFVGASVNGTFILKRGFLEYHSDRFTDHSLLLYKNKKLAAIIPASESGNKIFSHGGLTYGGLIVTPTTNLFTTLSCMYSLVKYYHLQGFKHILYKPVPWFFHIKPYFEDIYALFLMGSTLTAVNTGFVTDLATPVVVPKDGRYIIRKAKACHVRIVRAQDCRTFWNTILVPYLDKRFGASPVHTIQEIELLRKRFPKNILQYYAMIKKQIVAGVTIFLDHGVAHCQYIAGMEVARKTGANDYLMWHLMTKTFKSQRFFSFGTANMGSSDGRKLSRGLIAWKEGFGATMAPYLCYDIETKNYRALQKYHE